MQLLLKNNMIQINCGYKLISLYGPCAINSYGFFIALAIVITVYCMVRNKRFNALNISYAISDIIAVAIIAGILGGRFLEVVSEPALYPTWQACCAFWEGGFSALGSIIGVLCIVPLYVRYLGIAVIKLADVIAIYAPLFQAIARLGCFIVGCCHGIPTKSIFGVMYIHPETVAQLSCAVHPTQLYSSCLLLGIFLYMFLYAQYRYVRKGQLVFIYIVLSAAERFVVDFWRNDRVFVMGCTYFSFFQIVAIIMIGAACASYAFYVCYTDRTQC